MRKKLNKDNFIKFVKQVYNLNNEQESNQEVDKIDLLIEKLFEYMEQENIEQAKIGKYIELEVESKKERKFKNPRTKEESILPAKKFKKIKQTDKLNT